MDSQTRGPSSPATSASASMPSWRSARAREPSMTTSARPRSSRSAARPVGRPEVVGDAALPGGETVEEGGRAAAGAVGPRRRLDLDDVGATIGEQPAAERSRPERGEVDDDRSACQCVGVGDAPSGDRLRRRRHFADSRDGQAEEGSPLRELGGCSSRHHLLDRVPRRPTGVGLEPGGDEVEVVVAGEVRRQPMRRRRGAGGRRRHMTSIPAGSGHPPPLARRGGAGDRRRSARRAAGSGARRRAGGTSGGAPNRPVRAMAPLAAHASASSTTAERTGVASSPCCASAATTSTCCWRSRTAATPSATTSSSSSTGLSVERPSHSSCPGTGRRAGRLRLGHRRRRRARRCRRGR